MLTPLLCL